MELLQVHAHEYAEKSTRIHLAMEQVASGDIWADHKARTHLIIELEDLQEMCATGELPVTKVRVDHLLHCLRVGSLNSQEARAMRESLNNNLFSRYLLDLRSRLVDELSTKLFFQLPHSRKELFEKPCAKWESVIARWPETILDIEEAGKCFALSRYAASVFHCVQIIEHGLLRLGNFLGVHDPHSGWTAVAGKLRKIVETDYDKKTDFEKQNSAFIEQMQGTVEALKNAWRNKISHAHGKLVLMGADFTPDVAEEIMTASRAFMRRLSEELPT